eukprot:gnl/TRDRNA2_/TRDRNA2_84410_c0_seq2.p1 gnl/TRDRNA2_/TRDRNA2_84410_c0~~gnl/TRDRNA2_/TRDRNA2_84410_c0_seq2.p1  ORF type:complete len:273 (+),score=34.42 gnl/TRDRNA2_/TRDRNA2_84410_c0_seq2:113-931(+)
MTPKSQPLLPPIDSEPLPKFDTLTLREWFNKLDDDRTGSVTKPRWLDFLSRNPEFRTLILGRGITMRITKDLHEEARRIRHERRRLGQLWSEIDTDRNGSLEWFEFLDFFQRSGRLLVYKTKDNPRDRLAGMLQEMHEQQNDLASEAERNEFNDLSKKYLDLGRRRSLGAAVEEAKSRSRSDSNSSTCSTSTKGSFSPMPPCRSRPEGLAPRRRQHLISDDVRLAVELPPPRGRPQHRLCSVSDEACMFNRMREFSLDAGPDHSMPAPIAAY